MLHTTGSTFTTAVKFSLTKERYQHLKDHKLPLEGMTVTGFVGTMGYAVEEVGVVLI
jgi:hypothetical protein